MYKGIDMFAVDKMRRDEYISHTTMSIFFIQFQLYSLNVLTLTDEAEVVLFCPTSSPVPGPNRPAV